jgi:uncharacterized metal-binding protein
MSAAKQRVVIVPCSGIGKPFGSVSREAAYEVCENLCPNDTELVALAKLVMGEGAAQAAVAAKPAITIDGCKLMCAAKMVKLSGGVIAREVTVFDAFRQHKDLKPKGVAELNEAGIRLASAIAQDIATTVAGVRRSGGPEGGAHA